MNTNDNKEKPKTAHESGVAENDRANYSELSTKDSTDRLDNDDKDDIRETNDPEEGEHQGGDLAGNAAGNEADEENDR